MKNSLYYLAIELIVRGIPFFITPIFIALLSKKEFGILSLYIAIIPLYSILFDLSQRMSIKKFYYDYRYQTFNLMFSIIISILIFSVSIFLCQFDFIEGSNNQIIFFNILLYVILEQYLTYMQISKNVLLYNIVFFMRNALPYIFAVIFIYVLNNNTHLSLVYAQLSVFLLLNIFVFSKFFKKINFKLVSKYFFKYIKYSLSIAVPVLPVVMSAYILSVSDRYMIQYFYSYNEVATYSLAYTIAMIVQLFTMAIAKAWQPFIFDNLKSKNYSLIKKNAIYYIFSVIFVIAIVYGLKEYLVLFLGNADYLESVTMIPVLLLGMFFFFLYSMFSNVIFYYKKMFLFGLPAMIAAISNVILNYIFLPKYGYEIAATTTMISYFVEFLVIGVIIIYLIPKIKEGRLK